MMQKLSIIFGVAVFALFGFVLMEAPQASADQSVSSATLPASLELGFAVTLDVSGGIRMTIPVTAVSLGSFSSLSGGNGSSTADLNVATTNYLGYTLAISSLTSPAMINADVATATAISTSGYYFANATAAASSSLYYDPDSEFSSTTSKFGFAVSSTDAVSAYKNDGLACGLGANVSASHCFGGFSGTGLATIASANSATSAAGTTSTLRFLAQMGSAVATPLASGSYRAIVVATAYTN